MNDLRGGFPDSGGSLDLARARAGLEWLARFHACFWQQTLPEGLWRQGTYWHLSTRYMGVVWVLTALIATFTSIACAGFQYRNGM